MSLYVLYAVIGSPKNEGLVDISENNQMRGIKDEEVKASQGSNLSSLQIFYYYILKIQKCLVCSLDGCLHGAFRAYILAFYIFTSTKGFIGNR